MSLQQRGGLFDSLRAAIQSGRQVYNSSELVKKTADSKTVFCKYNGDSPVCQGGGSGDQPAWMNYQGGAVESDSESDDDQSGGFLDSLRASVAAAKQTYQANQYKQGSEKSFSEFCKYHGDSAVCQVGPSAVAPAMISALTAPLAPVCPTCPTMSSVGGASRKKSRRGKGKGLKKMTRVRKYRRSKRNM